jgi:hypothetical protein
MGITILNAFIVALAIGAVWLGVSAVVQKRTVHRDKKAHRSTNAAS